ncbi:MAG: hypothetical protein ABIG93_01940 [archaeon]|nr:hypothetical protein [Nanoarchaeota archaeon]
MFTELRYKVINYFFNRELGRIEETYYQRLGELFTRNPNQAEIAIYSWISMAVEDKDHIKLAFFRGLRKDYQLGLDHLLSSKPN